MKKDKKLLSTFLEKMFLVRQFEYKIYEFATKGIVFGSVHLCIGEEATAVGSCMDLESEDFILTTHRGHGQALTKGADPDTFLAEISGRETGVCKGRVGSMHAFDKENNNLGAQGILGAQFPIAVGVGLALKLKKSKNIVACYFGDGTSNQGTFYEALNMADIWNLPIFFVCVNNFYGMGTHYDKTSNVDVFEKAKSFNIITETADGNDVEEVYIKAKKLISKVREDKRPALLECHTYRWLGHSAFDNRSYRPKEEIEEWKSKDPIKSLEKKMIENGQSSKDIEIIKKNINKKIEEAAKFALESGYSSISDTIKI